MGRAAIEAALKRQADAMQQMQDRMSGMSAGPSTEATGFKESLKAVDGLQALDNEVKQADALAEKLISGEVTDFHEVAAQLKQSDLSFKFALQVRNKFVDAYREVMRMSV